MQNIVIIGFSGHAKVVIDCLVKANQYNIVGLIDKAGTAGDIVAGYPVLGKEEDLPGLIDQHQIHGGIIAIGDNWVRSKVQQKISALLPDFKYVVAVHPSVQIGTGACLGAGSVVMAGAIVNPNSVVGEHCIVNTNASIDHDNKLGDFVSVAPGVTLGGDVNVGEFSVISLGANVIHGITLGKQVVIGAGATVLNDIADHSVAYGMPAKVIRTRADGERYL